MGLDYVEAMIEMEEMNKNETGEPYTTRIILGVGDGTGNLFVEGDYDSITRVQKMIFELEELRRENKRLIGLTDDKYKLSQSEYCQCGSGVPLTTLSCTTRCDRCNKEVVDE